MAESRATILGGITDESGRNYTMPGPWRTVAEVRAANKAIEHHWFDRDTMRGFGSRILGGMIGGRLFISSERSSLDDVRGYSVRVADDRGGVSTFGEFLGYRTAADARRAARSEVKRCEQSHEFYHQGGRADCATCATTTQRYSADLPSTHFSY